MRSIFSAAACIAATLSFASICWAQQQDPELKSFMDSVDKRLKSLEQGQPAPKAAAPWTDFLRFYGDVRLRHEINDTQTTDMQHRARMRVRLGLEAKVNEETDLNLRMTTAQGGDPVSANQTFDSGASKKPFDLDMAFVDWRPSKDSHVYGGKMKNPFFQPGGSQLIWDHDLTPEGFAANTSGEICDSSRFFVTGGGFWIDERPTAPDGFLWGFQGGAVVPVGEDTLKIGTSFFHFANMQGFPPAFAASGKGNTLSGGNYVNDYRELEFFLEWAFLVGSFPVVISGDAVNNVATGKADHGWLVSAAAGKLTDPGSWAARWIYKVLEADAVVADFTDSDAWGGGTNGRGHEFGVDVQLAKKVSGGVTYYRTETTLGTYSDFHRVDFDVIFKF